MTESKAATKPRLVAISGPMEGQTFELDGDCFSIGRKSGSDLKITRPEVSRRHCEVTRSSDGRFTLRDLDSSHGTFVNGQPIRQKELRPGDLVTLGKTTLLFLLDAAAVVPPLQGTEALLSADDSRLRGRRSKPSEAYPT